MGNSYGNLFRFTIFGQSHAPAIGVTVEGLPAGEKIDLEALQAFLARRAPGGKYSTARKEADKPEFIAGLTPDGLTCGSPLTAVIRNTDTRSGDYSYLANVPRPGHADYPAMIKYGAGRDYAGGGQFSGRLTAPLCIAGGIAKQLLEKRGITISARIVSIGGETEEKAMFELIDRVRSEGDSVGGVIECVAEGVPAMGVVLERWPEADRQHLRQLIAAAATEREQNRPPAASRKLFRYLRELAEL